MNAMTIPETVRFEVGRFSCLALKDGGARYPVAMFLTNIDRERYEPWLRERGQDPECVDVPYLCLVIDAGSERVLVDTGTGVARGGGGLLPLLRREGIEPHTIGTVILSHGHGDHVGGNLDADGKPAFPKARHVILRKEWDFWMSSPSLEEWSIDESMKKSVLVFTERNLSGVEACIDLIEPGTEIVPGVSALAAFGHSPGHMGLDIRSAGERLLFVADAVVLPAQFAFPEAVGMTDHRPAEMVATRLALLEQAARGGHLVCASHLPFPGLGYVKARGAHWEWQPA